MFSKVLVANRGEIAVRVMRACRELGVRSVAVYSDADRNAMHVRVADEAVHIGPSAATASYLNGARIVAAAVESGAEAIHPGYGFLSENAEFAQTCLDAGLVFIGPPPEVIRAMGSKIEAKQLAASLGIPLLPGYDGQDQDATLLQREADRIGYPLLIKASAGGGGRGMRVVTGSDLFHESLASAKREALSAFGDDRVLLEPYLARPRHIEVQVFADRHGNIVELGERECSIQRRHQKVIEEAPSPFVTAELRAQLGVYAVRLAQEIGYEGAGTVEFIVDQSGRPAFLEMNTRLQVEHAVTELVTGVDLVQLQLRVAAGESLPFAQEHIEISGHAIECRIYAEDPAADFQPSTGVLRRFAPPEGPEIRNDAGFEAGDAVSPFYDSMLAKLIVRGVHRETAIAAMTQALDDFRLAGVRTNLRLLRKTITHPEFALGNLSTAFLDEFVLPFLGAGAPDAAVVAAAATVATFVSPSDPWRAGWRASGANRVTRLRADASLLHATVRRVDEKRWSVMTGDYSFDVSTSGGGDLAVSSAESSSAVIANWATDGGDIRVSVNGRTLAPGPSSSHAALNGERSDSSWYFELAGAADFANVRQSNARAGSSEIVAPLAGVVARVAIGEGDAVAANQVMVIIEAMKMEHVVSSPRDGTAKSVLVKVGDLVQGGAVLVELG